MVNSLFVAQGREQNMPTLDVGVADLVEGTVSFRKYGACDSYIRRDTHIERVRNAGYPLGFHVNGLNSTVQDLLQEGECPNPEDDSLPDSVYELNEGDCILMISDGVLECYGDERALLQTFSKMEIQDAEEAANFLMQCTIRRCAGRIRDDMTILVGKLTANQVQT